MWLIINVIIMLTAIAMIAYGKYIDSSENYEALIFLIFGVIFIVIGAISETIRFFV